jgi:hypothetical protein
MILCCCTLEISIRRIAKYQIADIALRYVGFKARGPYTGQHNMLE